MYLQGEWGVLVTPTGSSAGCYFDGKLFHALVTYFEIPEKEEISVSLEELNQYIKEYVESLDTRIPFRSLEREEQKLVDSELVELKDAIEDIERNGEAIKSFTLFAWW